jgi:hypothetical protein
MAQTLLALCQAASDEISFARPVSLFSNPDTTARQMLALANREGDEQATYGEWPDLRREYTFNTVAGTASYAFPTDYSRIIGSTEWDRGARWPLNGPLTAQEWQVFKSGFGNAGPRRRFRIMQGRIYLDPTPDSVTTIAFEYEATSWVLAADGVTYRNAWGADTDTFVLNEQVFIMGLKWRLLRAKGQDYDQEYAAWRAALDRAFARADGTRVLAMNSGFGSVRLVGPSNIPDAGFGS